MTKGALQPSRYRLRRENLQRKFHVAKSAVKYSRAGGPQQVSLENRSQSFKFPEGEILGEIPRKLKQIRNLQEIQIGNS
jgi:hypothetical protein